MESFGSLTGDGFSTHLNFGSMSRYGPQENEDVLASLSSSFKQYITDKVLGSENVPVKNIEYKEKQNKAGFEEIFVVSIDDTNPVGILDTLSPTTSQIYDEPREKVTTKVEIRKVNDEETLQQVMHDEVSSFERSKHEENKDQNILEDDSDPGFIRRDTIEGSNIKRKRKTYDQDKEWQSICGNNNAKESKSESHSDTLELDKDFSITEITDPTKTMLIPQTELTAKLIPIPAPRDSKIQSTNPVKSYQNNIKTTSIKPEMSTKEMLEKDINTQESVSVDIYPGSLTNQQIPRLCSKEPLTANPQPQKDIPQILYSENQFNKKSHTSVCPTAFKTSKNISLVTPSIPSIQTKVLSSVNIDPIMTIPPVKAGMTKSLESPSQSTPHIPGKISCHPLHDIIPSSSSDINQNTNQIFNLPFQPNIIKSLPSNPHTIIGPSSDSKVMTGPPSNSNDTTELPSNSSKRPISSNLHLSQIKPSDSNQGNPITNDWNQSKQSFAEQPGPNPKIDSAGFSKCVKLKQGKLKLDIKTWEERRMEKLSDSTKRLGNQIVSADLECENGIFKRGAIQRSTIRRKNTKQSRQTKI